VSLLSSSSFSPPPRATVHGVDLLCHRAQGAPLPLPGPLRLLQHCVVVHLHRHDLTSHTNTAVSNCSRGGPPYPSPDDDNVVAIISSCSRRSLQLQVFSDTGAIRWTGERVYPYPPDPWGAGMGRCGYGYGYTQKHLRVTRATA
jgi:hypothetical protein